MKDECKESHSLQLYQDLVETSQDLIWQCDAGGRYTFLNKAWVRVFGYSLAEMLGRPFSDFQTPEMPARDQQEFTRLMQEGTVIGYETVHIGKSGDPIHLVFNAKAVFNEKGEFCGTRGTAYDNTKYKHLEDALEKRFKALERSQILLNATGRMANVGGWEINLIDNSLTWTNQVYLIHEVDSDFQPTVEKAISFYAPESRPIIQQAVQASLDHGSPFDVQLQIITAKGNRRWVRAIGKPHLEDNKLIRISGVFQDITERKEIEDAIAAEKELLAVTLRSIGDGVITTNIQGKVAIMNKIAEELTGWTAKEAKGKPLSEVFNIVDELSRQPCENPVDKVLDSSRIIELSNHTLLLAKDGSERVIADSGAPIKSADSKTIGVVLVFRDMTEKQKLFETFQRNQKLESLGVLAGGIAHDFNNLLGSIFGYIDLARYDSKDPMVSEYLEKSMRSIERARGLTQQLLTFAKGGAPIREIDHLFPFIQETTLFALSGSNVLCVFEIPENLWPCAYDRNQIAQVIDNLVINAQQAMPLGGTIELSARNVTLPKGSPGVLSGGNYVRVSVKDQGIGMPRELLSRIFDPFFTTKSKGHGLGLSTCHSIIARHNGALDVDSAPGKGTTFHFFLPASSETAGTPIQETHVSPKGTGTILVMDDEPMIRSAIGDMLKALGYEPIVKKDGPEILAFIAEARQTGTTIAVILLDLTIPGGMGGKEVVAKIRESDSSVPVIVSSGYAEDPVMANPALYGFNASICKPFRLSELAKTLKTVLGQ